MRLYNTQSLQVKEFQPHDSTVTLYVCGITPYDATHLGYAPTYPAFALLPRAWLDAAPEPPGSTRFTVVYVQNVTDVDDPLLERADRDGEDWRELAAREIQRYREDMAALGFYETIDQAGFADLVMSIPSDEKRVILRGLLDDLFATGTRDDWVRKHRSQGGDRKNALHILSLSTAAVKGSA